MSDSITPFGTTRSVFSLATNDLEINGDITASKFVGSGDKLTNIRIKSINQSTYNNNEYLLRSLGGTGNNYYIDKNGTKKLEEMNTGDSMYISPYTPHSFTTRKNNIANCRC